jgi:two-component system LytT family response regulator
MQILIIEDEGRTANRLEKQIKQILPKAKILGILDSVKTSVQWLMDHEPPELIFMDIHLADGSSFEILEAVETQAPIIFTTAYDKYAIDAFKANSVDYLLKPIKHEELVEALEKLEKMKKIFQEKPLDTQQIAKMIRGEISPYQQRFLIRLTDQFKTYDVKEVAYFFIESRITFMQLKSGKTYPIDFSLDQLEGKLHPARFFRLNRQFTISYESISRMIPFPKSRIKLELTPPSNKEAIVSSERSAAFKNWLLGSEVS